jgi:hypothetical protein
MNDYGGGIYNRGVLTLTNCSVTHNVAEGSYTNTYGGGIYNYYGKLTLIDSTVSDNEAVLDKRVGPRDCYGAGIANYGGIVNLVNCTINNNVATGNFVGSSGGGLYNYGDAFLTNCTFVANSADNGGGLQNNGDAEIVACTFSQNRAYFGGGMFLWKSLDMWNTIVAGNSAGIKGPDVDGTVHSGGNNNPDGGHNLVGNTSGSSGWASTPGKGTDLTNVDAALESLASNGGPTLTMALSVSSPAIRNGSTVRFYAGTTTPLEIDQRGCPLDSPPDIGAYQVQNS